MEYYSTLMKNKIMAFAGKWMELETIMLSEISQYQKTKDQMFSLISGCQSTVGVEGCSSSVHNHLMFMSSDKGKS